MKKKSLFLFIIFLVLCIKCFSQNQNRKLELKTEMGYAFLREGDYGGFYYFNKIEYPLQEFIHVSGSIGYLISSNNGKKNISLAHNISFLQGDISLIVNPVKLTKFYLNFGLGGSVRHRSETEIVGLSIINGVTTLKYSTEDSFDIGYLGQLGFGFKVTHRTSFELEMGIHSYNKGTSVSSIGLGINLKL
jgi:hypothetical protein